MRDNTSTVKRRYLDRPIEGRLRWTQPHALTRHHELRLDGRLFATLRWKKMFGSLAVAEFYEGSYTFKRAGFLRPYITIRRKGVERDFAVMRFASGSVIKNAVVGLSGTLEFETGERFTFNRLNFWKSRWAFSDENGNLLMTLDRRIKGKPSGTVTVNRDFINMPYMHILVAAGWYAVIMDYEEEEAAIGTGLHVSSSD